MGWLIGCISKNNVELAKERITPTHPTPLHTFSTSKLYISAGGIEPTCLSCVNSPAEEQSATQGWIICGLGVRRDGNHAAFLVSNDWDAILCEKQPKIEDLDGHFIICRWMNDKVEFFSDQLGIRTMYFVQDRDDIYFSTRLDWITKFAPAPCIDFSKFGSRWILYNQLSQECDIRGIKKLGQSGYACINSGSVQLKSTLWKPQPVADSIESYSGHLSALANPLRDASYEMSLSLSGGFDSRVLLALLLKNRRDFGVHFFGDPAVPDVRIAQKIARKENLRSMLFNDPLPSGDECISLLRNYAAQAYIGDPATTILKLRYYNQLHARGKFVIDGAFGELARRVYLTRLLYAGNKAMHSGNPGLIAPYFAAHRRNIFNVDATAAMKQGIETQIKEAWDAMPPISEIGEGNFLDLLTLRTRVPNWCSLEQTRVDQQAICYMPYLQPSLLNIVFSLPIPLRKNGKLLREILRATNARLTRFPLVKGNTTYPYYFNPIATWLWTNAKKRLGFEYNDPLRHQVFSNLKPFIMDTVESGTVRNFQAYDHKALKEMVTGYYSGNTGLASQLDWWLAFELWRQGLGIRS